MFQLIPIVMCCPVRFMLHSFRLFNPLILHFSSCVGLLMTMAGHRLSDHMFFLRPGVSCPPFRPVTFTPLFIALPEMLVVAARADTRVDLVALADIEPRLIGAVVPVPL